MAGMHVLLRYTRLGKAMRATAANKTLARNCGIRTGRTITVTWAVTGALCGLAGVVFAMNAGSFDATSVDLFLVMILAAVFLGGPGQAYGAMLGAVDHRPCHRGQRRLHPARLQVRDRLRGAARDARRAPVRTAWEPAHELVLSYQPARLRRRRRDGLPRPQPAVRRRRASPTSASSSSRRPAPTRRRSSPLPNQSANGGFQSYIGGWNLPFPLPWIGAAVVGGLLALPFTFLVGRRLRGDFAAVGLLVTAVLLNLLVHELPAAAERRRRALADPLRRFGQQFSAQSPGYQWAFTAGAIIVCASRLPVRPPDHRVPVRAGRCAPCGTATSSPIPWVRTCCRCAPRCW